MITTLNVQHRYLRPLDVRRDLLAVAELIELCFANQMDPEGREYVRQIRRAGQDTRYIRWIPGAHERMSFPLHGYVWEQDDRIVGNLTLIPFYRRGAWRYLIANVAVHPDYRRHGIGRDLTERALEHIQEQGVNAAWLQVREDNQPAYDLYHQLGFRERARRSTWHSSGMDRMSIAIPGGIRITRRAPEDWARQESWLQENYPPEVAWNLPLNIRGFQPGWWSAVRRALSGQPVRHWSARRGGELTALLTWEQSLQYVDNLWLAAPEGEEDGVLALLVNARRHLQYSRSLSVNYPAGKAAGVFEASGFHLHNTLIWMAVEF